MGNPFVHVELLTDDMAKAKDFYGKLFDWKLEDNPATHYTMIGVGKGLGGGMVKHPVPAAPSQWLPYVEVDDVAAAIAKAKSLGATVCKDVTAIGEYGWYGVITDPSGASLGLHQMTGKK